MKLALEQADKGICAVSILGRFQDPTGKSFTQTDLTQRWSSFEQELNWRLVEEVLNYCKILWSGLDIYVWVGHLDNVYSNGVR